MEPMDPFDVDRLEALPVFAQITEHARRSTMARAVVLSTWSPATGVAKRQAFSVLRGGMAIHDWNVMCRAFSADGAPFDVHVNAIQSAVYEEGEAVTGPFQALATGALPSPVAADASRTLGLYYTTLEPLVVKGVVVGTLAFHGVEAPTDAQTVAYQAFAQQASLTIENALLFSQLQDHLKELKEARRLIASRNEAVRREIAERLHGSVQTQLVVADFTLRRASALVDERRDEAKQAIADARAMIDNVREHDIREMSHVLHPWVIGLGLAPALRSLADRFRSMMRINLRLDEDLDGVGTVSVVEMDDATRLASYRVVEEALANALRHGQARSVTVTATLTTDDRLTLSVADDGIGVGADVRPGLGLRLIAMQVDSVGGKWSIGAREPGGTVVTASLPLRTSAVVEAGNRAGLLAR